MRRIEYNVFRRDTRSASGKAKYDASDILASMGFERMYEPSRWRPFRVAQQMVKTLSMPKDVIVAIQYPGNKDFFSKCLNRRGIQTIAIVHDVDSLRNANRIDLEAQSLRLYDCLITHNQAMTSAVRKMGYPGSIVELGLFDYLASNQKVNPRRGINVVAFAGNFSKAAFVADLGNVKGLEFMLYGASRPDLLPMATNVHYQGSFPSEEIAAVVEGGWGLVWDGQSIQTCSGSLGEYLRYNCPHKASMYLVAERPLIVWKESAIAPIVRREGIGVLVSSISDAAKAIESISADEYRRMVENVRRVKNDLVKGCHLRKAVSKALDLLGRSDEQL